jgi:site-specific DNA-methyltransferase (adenine-specific)
MLKERLTRIDGNDAIRNELLPYCRMRYGQVWEDPECGHRVACLDATDKAQIELLVGDNKATLAVQDPPYNVAVGNVNNQLGSNSVQDYVDWSGGGSPTPAGFRSGRELIRFWEQTMQ